MNWELFISKRLSRKKGKTLSRPVIRIATLSIGLGIAVMILSIAVLQGFKNEIKEKIVGFGSHIQILPFYHQNSYASQPLILSQKEKEDILSIENVKAIQPFASKGGLIKTSNDFQAVVLKGLDSSFDTSFFHHYLTEGRFLSFEAKSNEAIVSKYIAQKLGLGIGDKIRVYFYIDDNYRARALTISGIYETGLSDYDKSFVLCSMNHIQRLNKWKEDEVEGYEVLLKDFSLLEESCQEIYAATKEDKTVETIEDLEPTLFTWLGLLDSNVFVILTIMILVSIFTITSTLLIIIFERTQTIGILKGFGASNKSIRKIFMYNAIYIIGKGLIYGNLLALSLGFVQSKYQIMKLDQESYFLSSVPVDMSIYQILFANICTILICVIALLIPLRNINKISPKESIRFD